MTSLGASRGSGATGSPGDSGGHPVKADPRASTTSGRPRPPEPEPVVV